MSAGDILVGIETRPLHDRGLDKAASEEGEFNLWQDAAHDLELPHGMSIETDLTEDDDSHASQGVLPVYEIVSLK